MRNFLRYHWPELVLICYALLSLSAPSLAQRQGGIAGVGPSVQDVTTLQGQVGALQTQLSAQAAKAASVPNTGPGVGLCRDTIVPSPLITSNGTTGSAGTCSTIIQCGTSSAYVVKQFNVGSGC